MKIIFKIEEYLPERNSIIIKTCRLHSHKSIDDYFSVIVDLNNFDLYDTYDTNDLIDDLLEYFAIRKINSQDQKESILESNQPQELNETLDFNSIIGKVFMGETFDAARLHGKTKKLKMRRVEL